MLSKLLVEVTSNISFSPSYSLSGVHAHTGSRRAGCIMLPFIGADPNIKLLIPSSRHNSLFPKALDFHRVNKLNLI